MWQLYPARKFAETTKPLHFFFFHCILVLMANWGKLTSCGVVRVWCGYGVQVSRAGGREYVDSVDGISPVLTMATRGSSSLGAGILCVPGHAT